MILIDTSVWVDVFRSADRPEASVVRDLIDADLAALAATVKFEILMGASKLDTARLRRLLVALPCWYPAMDDWKHAEGWIEPSLRAGHRFGFADLLIAAIGARRGAKLWSQDGDFKRMAALGFVDLFRP